MSKASKYIHFQNSEHKHIINFYVKTAVPNKSKKKERKSITTFGQYIVG